VQADEADMRMTSAALSSLIDRLGARQSADAQLDRGPREYALAGRPEWPDHEMPRLETEDARTELRAVTGPDYGWIWDHELVAAVMRIAGNGTGDTRWKVPGTLTRRRGAAGKWTDAATGAHGDPLDLIALNRGQPTRKRSG
jgi:hypothetical protein